MRVSESADRKLISIIIATYNCGQKIENTLDSIFSQNEELYEVIVFDGASTDDTLEYLKKYETRLTLISEKDGGVYDAFNKGIDLAAGEYIYFIGAGDCLKPRILEEIAQYLPPESPTLVYGVCYFVKQKVYNGRKFGNFDFVFTNICHQGEFYHRRIFEIVGKYDPQYKVFADWFFNLRCFLDEKVAKQFIPLVVADYEEGGLSATLNNDPQFKKDFPQFVKKKLGNRAYAVCRLLMFNPEVFYFIYNAGFNLLGFLIFLARPFVRGYRKLRKI